jgi:hypothetical protein
MATLPNITDTVIATGYNCQVRVGTNASDAQPIALVTSFQAIEEYQVHEATCIGNLGPVSIDPRKYACNITLDGYLPARKTMDGKQQYADGGKTAIMDHIPKRAQYTALNGAAKIAYMDLYNKKEGKVLAAFEGVLITNNGISLTDGNEYIRNNVRAQALSMS